MLASKVIVCDIYYTLVVKVDIHYPIITILIKRGIFLLIHDFVVSSLQIDSYIPGHFRKV